MPLSTAPSPVNGTVPKPGCVDVPADMALQQTLRATDGNLADNTIAIPGGQMREAVSTKDAPQALGPYSQAIKANGFVFVSGQAALDPHTGKMVEGGIVEQTERTLTNLAAILKAAGSGLDKAVRVGVFLKDMRHFQEMNEVYARHFAAGPPPARVTVEAARLPKDALVEIDIIALA